MRSRIVADLVRQHANSDDPVLVVHELGLGRGSVRADLFVITTHATTGIEIKSAADTLTRLPKQAGWYDRVCDRCVLAGDPDHVDAGQQLVPGSWGLVAVDHDGVRTLRPPTASPTLDPVALANLLWMPELKAAVAEAGQAGGTAGLERIGLAQVFAAAAGEETGRIVRQQLLGRAWVDVTDPVGPVRVVRQPKPSKKVARVARVRNKYERRALREH